MTWNIPLSKCDSSLLRVLKRNMQASDENLFYWLGLILQKKGSGGMILTDDWLFTSVSFVMELPGLRSEAH